MDGRVSRCPDDCSGRGTCDGWRGVCSCPIGFAGLACEQVLLPACMLGDHFIPIRAWLLHGLEGGAGQRRWQGSPRALGPVPCRCLLQLISFPFLLRRVELNWLRDQDEVRCVNFAAGARLWQYIENPNATALRAQWHRFSIVAADDARKAGVEATLWGGAVGSRLGSTRLRTSARWALGGNESAARKLLDAHGLSKMLRGRWVVTRTGAAPRLKCRCAGRCRLVSATCGPGWTPCGCLQPATVPDVLLL